MLTHPAEARRRFREYAEGEITNENLALGALLIALEDHPGIDIEHYIQELAGLADRVAARAVAGEPPVFLLGHLHAEMFDVDGYRGDALNYHDPRNAYLDEVIDRRLGLPISLSIIFLDVASKLGLAAAGVGLPGHYIVKVQFELNEVYVDPFQGGETLSIAQIAELVRRSAGGESTLMSEHLRAWDGRATLGRVLANLEHMWLHSGDPRRARAARERRELLAQ